MTRFQIASVLALCLVLTGCTLQQKPVVQPVPDDREYVVLDDCMVAIKPQNEPSITFSRKGAQLAIENFPSDDTIDVVRAPSPNMEKMLPVKGFQRKMLVIESVSNGPVYKYFFYDLQGTPRRICSLANGACRARLVQSPGDESSYEFIVNDWYDDFGARAVAPEVTVRWNGNRFVFDAKAMKKPPDARELTDLRQTITGQFADPGGNDPRDFESMVNSAPPELADEVIGRVYSGNLKDAIRLLDQVWPKNRPGKEAYWAFLKSEMRKSPYWLEIVSLNNGSKFLTGSE